MARAPQPGVASRPNERCRTDLQISGLKTRVLGNTAEHPRPDLLAIVECEHEVGPVLSGERPV